MHRYVLADVGLGQVLTDLMAESPTAAMQAYERDAGEKGTACVERPPKKASGFACPYAHRMSVYSLPGAPVESLRKDQVSVSFLETVAEKVAIVGRLGQ